MEGRHGESIRDHLQPSLIEFGVVVEVAPLGLPMHHKWVQASGGETMKPLLRPLFTAMGSVINDHWKHRAANGTIGYMLGSIWS